MDAQRSGLIAALWIVSLVVGCSGSGPVPIHYGQDQCAYCKMTVMDRAFAAQLVTTKSKAYIFDSIECLAAFEVSDTISNDQVAGVWVSTIDRPGELVSSADVVFVRGENTRSPMGMGISAHLSPESAKDFALRSSGRILSWPEVKQAVRESWLDE